jgi:hypothetical protein
MKYVLILLSVVSLNYFMACNNKNESNEVFKIDSTTTSINFTANPYSNDYRQTTARRFIKKEYRLVSVDSNGNKVTQEKQLVTDTTYQVPIFYPIQDSLKKTLKTKTGQDSGFYRWEYMPKEMLLVDYNKKWNWIR